MSANLVDKPYINIKDSDGTALENGFVYIGTSGLDPVANPITAYWDQPLSVVAAQPVRTINGYLSKNGTPGKVYVDADDYSIMVKNKHGVLIYTSLTNLDAMPMSGVTGQLESDRVDFTQTGSGAVERTVEDKFNDIVSVKDFGAVGDGVTDDTSEVQAAIDSMPSGGMLYFPKGSYKVSSPIVLSSGLQLVGDGTGSTVISAISGFTGDNLVTMEQCNSSGIEGIYLDSDNKVDNGLYINDVLNSQLVDVKIFDVLAIGFKVRNVNVFSFKHCSVYNAVEAAFDFYASAALDASATYDGIDAVLNNCHSYNAGSDGTSGTIHSNQVDTSSIRVIVNQYKEISGTTLSVVSEGVHLDHSVQLNDCDLVNDIPSIAAIIKNNILRTGAISITSANTPIIDLGPLYEGSGLGDYSGLLLIIASENEISSADPGWMATYLMLVDGLPDTGGLGLQLVSAHGYIFGAAAANPSFTWKVVSNELQATPVASTSGSFYFTIRAIGDIKVTNV